MRSWITSSLVVTVALAGLSGCLAATGERPVPNIDVTPKCPQTLCFGCQNPWTEEEVAQAEVSAARCISKYGDNYCLVRLTKYDNLTWSAVCTHLSEITQ